MNLSLRLSDAAANGRSAGTKALAHSLHVVGSKRLGGAEGFFLRLARALQQAGAPVTCALRRGSDVVRAGEPDLRIVETPMRTVWDPWSRRRMSQAIRQVDPDIVQTYMGRATRLTHLRAGQRPVHVARLGGYYKLDGYRHAHAWIGNTKGVCDYLIAHGMPARRVFHIYNFVDSPVRVPDRDVQAERRRLAIPDDALVLMTAGRFVTVKGHAFLLEALARLPVTLQSRPVWLLMVGDGPLRRELQEQARQCNLADRIAWAGWRNATGVYFKMADLVVFPSLEEETLGNVILEAWSHAKPLVTAAFRGARELTQHQVDAWCVGCGDAAALAQGVRTVLSDPGLAGALASAGHRRVLEEFDRRTIVAQYLALYAQLLAEVA
jgi:glycosyltransferase involved in cell wall biosynthesis